MVARGDLGVKSGRGFYDWREARAFISSKTGEAA
jgi:3-hydroxyacyl-CoA dehydrogenase